jgi:hypothetical protein
MHLNKTCLRRKSGCASMLQAAVIILFNQTFILTKLCTEGIVTRSAFSPEISKVQLWN